MSDIPSENKDTKDVPKEQPPQEPLSSNAKRNIQGVELSMPEQQKSENLELTSADPDLQAKIEQWKRDHGPANWQYRFGSPHADHQAAKDLEKAQRQHDIGVQADTAYGLGDAIDTTLKAGREANAADETPMDEYIREKYGAQPYTTDAYPKEDEK